MTASTSNRSRRCKNNKLQDLAGKHSDVLESLTPNVRKRVDTLREIQTQHDELEAKFFEERAALEAKYQKLYQPLYTKAEMQRFTAKIVNMMKAERLYESQGGPIILSQIENEYDGVKSELGPPARAYTEWAAKMAVDLGTGVPWIMCKQSDAPDPIVQELNVARSLTLSEREVIVALAVSLDNDYFSRHGGWGFPFMVVDD